MTLALNNEQKQWLSKFDIDENTYLTLQQSIFPGAKPESIVMAVQYCRARKLDVLQKPVHIVLMPINKWDDTQKKNVTKWRDVIMPGIYLYRTTASRTGEYAGQDAPVFGDFIKLDFNGDQVSVPEYCTITVYRLVGSEKVAFSHTEWFEEACGTTKNGSLNSMWSKRKRGQLAKCAEAGALRKAFPEELGGLMTAEEAQETYESQSEPVHVNTVERVEKVDSTTIEKLRKLIHKAGSNEKMVCEIYNLQALEDLESQSVLDEITASLNHKIALTAENQEGAEQ